MTGWADGARSLIAKAGTERVRGWAERLQAGERPPRLDSFFDRAAGAGFSDREAAAYLLGCCAGVDDAWRTQRVDVTWTGPRSVVPVRATAIVLRDLIDEARYELVLMTYSATANPMLTEALTAAHQRGVRIDVVVETLQGAGGAITGAEPAAAFAAVPGVRLWHWPVEQRGKTSAKMHAKLAVADGRALLLTSANLTQSGTLDNLEAGVVLRGGTGPRRALEYVRELQATDQLQRLLG